MNLEKLADCATFFLRTRSALFLILGVYFIFLKSFDLKLVGQLLSLKCVEDVHS